MATTTLITAGIPAATSADFEIADGSGEGRLDASRTATLLNDPGHYRVKKSATSTAIAVYQDA